MGRWVDTLLELTSRPISAAFGVAEKIAGIPENEGLKHQLAVDVFSESLFRTLDRRSGDQTVPLGAILRIQRRGYRHYGVVSGPDKMIHYTGEAGDFGDGLVVRETDFAHFISGVDRFDVLDFGRSKKIFTPDETVARARQRMGEAEYGFFDNNCQHFAFWCKTGRSLSGQAPFWSKGGSWGAATLSFTTPDLIFLYGASVERVVFAATMKQEQSPAEPAS